LAERRRNGHLRNHIHRYSALRAKFSSGMGVSPPLDRSNYLKNGPSRAAINEAPPPRRCRGGGVGTGTSERRRRNGDVGTGASERGRRHQEGDTSARRKSRESPVGWLVIDPIGLGIRRPSSHSRKRLLRTRL
jgi:hypothetical protein